MSCFRARSLNENEKKIIADGLISVFREWILDNDDFDLWRVAVELRSWDILEVKQKNGQILEIVHTYHLRPDQKKRIDGGFMKGIRYILNTMYSKKYYKPPAFEPSPEPAYIDDDADVDAIERIRNRKKNDIKQ